MPSAMKPYRNLGRVRPDSKGRITLGKLAEGVSSYSVSADAEGRLVLEPYAELPARERWLFENKAARGRVLRGLADSAAGRVRSLGSFARHANSTTED